MFHLDPAAVADAVLREDGIHPLKGARFVLQAAVCRAHHPLAGAADGHDVQPEPLRLSEGPGVQRKGHIRIGLSDHAGAATGGGGKLDDLDA